MLRQVRVNCQGAWPAVLIRLNAVVTVRATEQVHQVLYSRKWEARVYAGEALAELASRISHPSCQDIAEKVEQSKQCTISPSLENFNYAVVLATRPPLLSTGDQARPSLTDITQSHRRVCRGQR